MGSATPEHLTVKRSGRGFACLPAIPDGYGGAVEVYESSAASGPHIWLAADSGVGTADPAQVQLHLTAENAWRLAEQLMFLVRNHYQGDVSPDDGLDAIRDELREHVANLGDKQPWDNRAMFDRVLAALEAHAGTSKAEG